MGEARLVDRHSDEENWCRKKHMENNTFDDEAEVSQRIFGSSPPPDSLGHRDAAPAVEEEDIRVVLVNVQQGRIADWKGGVKDWRVSDEAAASVDGVGRSNNLHTANGI